MRVIVCGGRYYANNTTVRRTLRTVLDPYPHDDVIVITGGAPGADTLAHELATDMGYATEVFHADWPAYGKGAGPIRNRRMLAAGADLVIAFPGNTGTADMVDIARKAGVTVHEVQP